MRPLFLIVFLTIVLTIAYFFRNFSSRFADISPTPLPTTKSSTSDGIYLKYKDIDFKIYLQKIVDRQKLVLIPNFSEKKSSRAIMEEYFCRYGVNAGFYTAEGKPLGLYFANGKLMNSKIHPSSLFNGFVFGNSNGLFDIRNSVPQPQENSLDYYFQTGPLFTPETKLTIRNDEHARRILIGKTSQGEFYFLALVDKDNVNNGPLLADLPAIIHEYNSQIKSNDVLFTSLINLDGGSASAFYNEFGVKFTELTPIGSFLCGKE